MDAFDRNDLCAQTQTLVLAGGRGERLAPLTRDRTKGAVPFAGSFRLIDFTLSNCLHSGLRRIAVLPQYKYASLERHLRLGWNIFRPELGEELTLLPPQMRSGDGWYEGTADAVYQNAYALKQRPTPQTLVLSSDHIYRMDYARLLDSHVRSGAELTIACMEVPLNEACRFGVVEVDPTGRIVSFEEKPEQPKNLSFRPDAALVSMGIYVFHTPVLLQELAAARRLGRGRDFGLDIIPWMLERGCALNAYDAQQGEGRDFYWRDIGVVDAYWEASMELLDPAPMLDLYAADWKFHSYQPVLPPARIQQTQHFPCQLVDSLICAGTHLAGARVERSILSPGVRVAPQAEVVDSVLMDGVRVGAGARIHRAIIDKDVYVPAGTLIGVDVARDQNRFYCSPGGVTVVAKGTELASESVVQVVDAWIGEDAGLRVLG